MRAQDPVTRSPLISLLVCGGLIPDSGMPGLESGRQRVGCIFIVSSAPMEPGDRQGSAVIHYRMLVQPDACSCWDGPCDFFPGLISQFHYQTSLWICDHFCALWAHIDRHPPSG